MSRPTWRRTPSGDMQFRFGKEWFDHHRSYKTKAEAKRATKRLRTLGYKVRTRNTRATASYAVCKKKK